MVSFLDVPLSPISKDQPFAQSFLLPKRFENICIKLISTSSNSIKNPATTGASLSVYNFQENVYLCMWAYTQTQTQTHIHTHTFYT